ncbi:hypothetical protein JXB27_03700 [Candidatus Woesearchaeota archaeon]|nr:hypothetical protein [Candidatus Woesearchaeota archaeon]
MKRRFSSLEERREFYKKEFSVKKVKSWFRKNKIHLPQICALDAGTESNILLNKKWKNTMFYFPFSELKNQIKNYVPEDVYYDRNTYKNPKQVLKTLKLNKWVRQELTFDLDVDNIPKRESFESRLRKIYKKSVELKNELKKRGFRKIAIVYSGKGFHVHVFDKKAYALDVAEREKLNDKFSDFPIDPWVSKGYIRLIRLPYSLHGTTSRKCLPVENRFDPKKAVPEFLKN